MADGTKKINSIQNSLLIAAGFSLILVFIKIVAFIYTGSMIVFASFFDSVSDTFTSLMNHIIYKKSIERPDKEHPFGHGGFEVIGSLLQGLVFAFFAVNVFIESVRRFFSQDTHHLSHESLPYAIAVLLFSALGGYFIQLYLSSHLKKMQKKRERSLVLLADHAHYWGDVISNSFSAVGLLVIFFLDWQFVDPILGCIGALFLAKAAYPILKKSLKDIAQNEAPEELQQIIVNTVMSVDPAIKGLHLLRSREFGPYLFVDFHMKVSDHLSLKEAHAIGDRVERTIRKIFVNADVLIHLDPESEPDQKYWDPSYIIPL